MIRLDKLTTGEPRPDAPSLCQATSPPVLPSGRRAGSRGNSARFRYLKPDKWDGSATGRSPDLTESNRATSAARADPQHRLCSCRRNRPLTGWFKRLASPASPPQGFTELGERIQHTSNIWALSRWWKQPQTGSKQFLYECAKTRTRIRLFSVYKG